MNPVAGAGVTLGSFLIAYNAAKMKGNLKNAHAVIEDLSNEIQAHLDARVVNFERYCAATLALADITGASEQDVIKLIETYRSSDTVRWKREKALVKMLEHHDIDNVNKNVKPVGEGEYGALSEQLAEEIRQMLDRLYVTAVNPPLGHEIEAGKAAAEAKRKAEAEAAAAKFKSEYERKKAVYDYHKERQERWAKKGPGLFGWRNLFAGPPLLDEPEPAAKSASNATTTTGPRPE